MKKINKRQAWLGVFALSAAFWLALGVSCKANAATFINSGSDSDYVYCQKTHTFGNCPTKGRLLDLEPVRDGVIRYRFHDFGMVFPWFYALVIDADNGVYREVSTVPATVGNANDLQIKGDYVILTQFSKANPADKQEYTQETFFKVAE